MTQEEKTIKLAEAAGFTDIMLPMGFHQQMSDEKSKECGGRWRFEIPKYFEDLNAVHELEKYLTQEQANSYGDHLANSKQDGTWAGCHIWHQSAEQRCEAIGKALNLW
jgi:hypothetical protein